MKKLLRVLRKVNLGKGWLDKWDIDFLLEVVDEVNCNVFLGKMSDHRSKHSDGNFIGGDCFSFHSPYLVEKLDIGNIKRSLQREDEINLDSLVVFNRFKIDAQKP